MRFLSPASATIDKTNRPQAPTMCRVEVDHEYPTQLIQFLLEYNDVALDHQIQAAVRGHFRCMPESWTSWASRSDHRWKDIMAIYTSSQTEVLDSDIPADLHRFIKESRSIPLSRTPFFVPESEPPSQVHAVSPKKLHEVFTMSSYIAFLFENHPIRPVVVDVGAGQGYLSRALSSSPNSFHVLALDADDNQTTGSTARKDWNATETATSETASASAVNGSLTHKTVFIGDTTSLTNSIEDWVQNELAQRREESGQSPLAIVLVGLHCCGDLTPSILKFMQHSLQTPNRLFTVVGCVVVGCCYNMCGPTSFPLSRVVSAEVSRLGPISLETQHLHLATQSPLMWNLEAPPEGPLSSSSAALAIRKVTYRALLARRLPALCRPEGDALLCADVDRRQNRVGRLRGSAYLDFPTYLRVARGKLGLEAKPKPTDEPGQTDGGIGSRATSGSANTRPQEVEYDLKSDLTSEETKLSRTLEVLYVLRCLVGPVVESLIATDRYLFLQEITRIHGEVANTDANNEPSETRIETERLEGGGKAELVNIFDQSTGSLRNLALVWVR